MRILGLVILAICIALLPVTVLAYWSVYMQSVRAGLLAKKRFMKEQENARKMAEVEI